MTITAKNIKLHPVIIPLMAISAGVIVANIYYNQPILKEIGDSVHASASEVGRISMLSQFGYGFGMFFLLPLGDKLNRKKLILTLCEAVGTYFDSSYIFILFGRYMYT